MTSLGGPDDGLADWGVLDDAFVRGGRKELSAAQRSERLARIAADHARLRGDARVPLLVAHPPPRRPRRARRRPAPRRVHGPWARPRSCLLAVVVLAAVALWSWGAREQAPRLEVPTAAARTQPLDPAGTAAPAGRGYSFLTLRPDGSGPVTFDGCAPISYVVRAQDQPPSGPAAVARAFAELSAATGLEFVDAGLTDEAPDEDRHLSAGGPGLGEPLPVLVAWATEREWPPLRGPIAGEAGPVTLSRGDATPTYVSGQVVLDADDLGHAPGDERAAAAVHEVLLHELGHLVGLGHVDDRAQLMYPEAHGQASFGPGDLAGLRVLGSGPCR